MTIDVRLSSLAVDDLRQARDHYAAIDSSLSDDFAAAVDAVIDRIRIFPHGAPPVDGFAGVRRARLRRFPYGLFYRSVDDHSALVIRVLHRAQNPRALEP